MMGFWDGSGISWTICKQSAPRSRQITTPTPHHSIFTGQMLFLTANKQSHTTTMRNQCAVTLHVSNTEMTKPSLYFFHVFFVNVERFTSVFQLHATLALRQVVHIVGARHPRPQDPCCSKATTVHEPDPLCHHPRLV